MTPFTAPNFEALLPGVLDGFPAALQGAVAANPVPFVAVTVIIVLILAARTAARLRPVPKDPSRLFSAAQKTEGFARAGGRCELEGFLFTRCKRPAQHGDHHYPWSRGGATSMSNFTAACARCNTSKGAKVPTAWATFRLEARRRKYFGALSVKAGERFVQR